MRNKLIRLAGFWRNSRGCRKRIGYYRGIRLALQLRRASYAAPSGTLVPVQLPNFRCPMLLRARSTDATVFAHIFVNDELAVDLPFSPRFIIDAGAYIGISSICFSLKYPEARIAAIELADPNYAMLRRNVSAYENITPMHCGLWWGPARLTVTDPLGEEWGFAASETNDPCAAAVPSLGVADLLREFGRETVDILKMDIEGAEIEVLTRNTDSWIDRVRCIVIELHDRCRPGCSEALARAIAGRDFEQRQQGEYVVLVRRS